MTTTNPFEAPADTTVANPAIVESIMKSSTRAFNESLDLPEPRNNNPHNLRFLDFVRPTENIFFVGVDSLDTVRSTVRFRRSQGHSGKVFVMAAQPGTVSRACRHTQGVRNIKEYSSMGDPAETLLVFNQTLNKSIDGDKVHSASEFVGRLFSTRFSRIYIDEHISWSDSHEYGAEVPEGVRGAIYRGNVLGQAFSKYRLNCPDKLSDGLLIHFCALCAARNEVDVQAFSDGFGAGYFMADDSRIVQFSLREGWEVNLLEQYTHPRVASIYSDFTGTTLTRPTSYHLLIARN